MHEPIAAVRDLKVGSSTRKVVLLVMADYARRDGSNIYASVGSIAQRAELARPTASRAIAELVEMGVLIQEASAPGRTSTYAINPLIMRGDLSPTVTGTCNAELQEVSPSVTGEYDVRVSLSNTGVSPTVTGGVTEDDRGCNAPLHNPKISQLDPNTSQDVARTDLALALIEIREEEATDPWYDPEAFPNEDVFASMCARSIESVKKFAGSARADREGCYKLSAKIEAQFPRGDDGEVDLIELSEFIEEWAQFNRTHSSKGGRKDGVASLRNWLVTKEGQHRRVKREREIDRNRGNGFGSRRESPTEQAARIIARLGQKEVTCG